MANEIPNWNLVQDQHINYATRVEGDVSVDLDEDSLQVEVIEGSGYNRQHTTTYIPIELIKSMLEHAGYKVTR